MAYFVLSFLFTFMIALAFPAIGIFIMGFVAAYILTNAHQRKKTIRDAQAFVGKARGTMPNTAKVLEHIFDLKGNTK